MANEFAALRSMATPAADWVPVVLLIMLGSWLEFEEPFHAYIQEEQLWQYSYPLKANTVPSWAVLAMTTTVPMAVAVLMYRFHRDRRELSRALLGLWTSLAITFFLTNFVKLMIGRPRPNFVARCWPDGQIRGIPGVPECSGDPHAAKEGRKSFPSGHSSLSFAGMGYLSFYLLGRLQPWGDVTNAPWLLFVPALPSLVAAWVALTRIRDYWHHPTDVMAGTVLGLACAYTAHAQHRGVLSGAGSKQVTYRSLSAGGDDSASALLLRGASGDEMLGESREMDV